MVHLDLHPGNVILTETKGPALVDWAKARAGAPELDVSTTALLIGEVAARDGMVRSESELVAAGDVEKDEQASA